MDRDQVKTLLCRIKVFYPKFEAVDVDQGNQAYRIKPAVIDAWYSRIGYLGFDQAESILDDHMKSEKGGRIPNVSVFLGAEWRKGKDWQSAWLNRRISKIRWQPEPGGEVFIIPVSFNQESGYWEDENGRLWTDPAGGI